MAIIHGKAGRANICIYLENVLIIIVGADAGMLYTCEVCEDAFPTVYYFNKHWKQMGHTVNKVNPGKTVGRPKKST